MCLSFSYLLWLLSEASGSTKLAKFLNDECTPARPQGEETNLISAKRAGWYWKSSGILPGPILEIFILIAWMNWMCRSEKSSLPLRELSKWSITHSFVCFLHVRFCLPLSHFPHCRVLLLIACLLKQKLHCVNISCKWNCDKILHQHISTYQIFIRGIFVNVLVTIRRNDRQHISIENHFYFSCPVMYIYLLGDNCMFLHRD